jgi:hypothetical protein
MSFRAISFTYDGVSSCSICSIPNTRFRSVCFSSLGLSFLFKSGLIEVNLFQPGPKDGYVGVGGFFSVASGFCCLVPEVSDDNDGI